MKLLLAATVTVHHRRKSSSDDDPIDISRVRESNIRKWSEETWTELTSIGSLCRADVIRECEHDESLAIEP